MKVETGVMLLMPMNSKGCKQTNRSWVCRTDSSQQPSEEILTQSLLFVPLNSGVGLSHDLMSTTLKGWRLNPITVFGGGTFGYWVGLGHRGVALVIKSSGLIRNTDMHKSMLPASFLRMLCTTLGPAKKNADTMLNQ